MGKISKVVKLSATWCGPCKKFKPVFESVGKDYEGVEFVEYDIENDAEGVENAEKYGVRSVPTTIVLDAEGNELGKLLGFMNEASFKDALNKLDNTTEAS